MRNAARIYLLPVKLCMQLFIPTLPRVVLSVKKYQGLQVPESEHPIRVSVFSRFVSVKERHGNYEDC